MQGSFLTRPATTGAAACLIVFLIVMGLVQARLLEGLDYNVAVAIKSIDSQSLERLSAWAATLLAFEACIAYATVVSLFLLSRRLGWWSLVPYAFVTLTLLELVLKITFYQPGVPSEFQRDVAYPFTVVTLGGSFPSGHAIRSAFLCVFLAVLLRRPGQPGSAAAAFPLGALALGLGATRLYLGYHWTSDVVAGLALGTSLALLLAPAVAERLRTHAVEPAAA